MESRGFPGYIGSWDCQHWIWKNCPVSWAGKFQGKEKKPTVVLEAIADSELWIWGCNFGNHGSMNDINILNSSSLYQSILEGNMLPSFEYTINNRKKNQLYYLVDGIYPKWAIFIDTIRMATSRKEKCFSGAQEAVRKDVERAFGVLVSRWHLLMKPCMFHNKELGVLVMKTGIIMHSMIVEARRGGYDSNLFNIAESAVSSGNYIDVEGNEKPFVWSTKDIVTADSSNVDFAWAQKLSQRNDMISDEVVHYSLKYDLVEHIWNMYGSA